LFTTRARESLAKIDLVSVMKAHLCVLFFSVFQFCFVEKERGGKPPFEDKISSPMLPSSSGDAKQSIPLLVQLFGIKFFPPD